MAYFTGRLAGARRSSRFGPHDHRDRLGQPDFAEDRGRSALHEKVLAAAAEHFTQKEYQELLKDMKHGLLEIRLYDEGIVLMRTTDLQ
jgi:hypothetical protein